MTTALLAMSDRELGYWRELMERHSNRTRYGCRHCHVHNCPTWTEARNYRAIGGDIDYDPLRDRRRAGA